MKQYRYTTPRYYLKWSCDYDIQLYKEVVKAAGGKYARECCQYGWSNQPKVVTWAGDAEINTKINKILTLSAPIILPVDW